MEKTDGSLKNGSNDKQPKLKNNTDVNISSRNTINSLLDAVQTENGMQPIKSEDKTNKKYAKNPLKTQTIRGRKSPKRRFKNPPKNDARYELTDDNPIYAEENDMKRNCLEVNMITKLDER